MPLNRQLKPVQGNLFNDDLTNSECLACGYHMMGMEFKNPNTPQHVHD